jgi:Protein of unknown function (DUF3016)
MNTTFKTCLVALALSAAGLPAGAVGSAEVRYVEPEKFTDAGFGSFERERTLQSLTQHFETLGKRLPDGQTLRVEVLDVNLAGEVWPRGAHEVRVLRGRADWPHMTLRYTVLDGNRTVKTGEARLADMNYLYNHQRLHDYGDLPYEKRMLDDWFKEAVAPATP